MAASVVLRNVTGWTGSPWVEVGRVGLEEVQGCSCGLHGTTHLGNLVGWQVVHDDRVAAVQGRHKDLLDIRLECRAVHHA